MSAVARDYDSSQSQASSQTSAAGNPHTASTIVVLKPDASSDCPLLRIASSVLRLVLLPYLSAHDEIAMLKAVGGRAASHAKPFPEDKQQSIMRRRAQQGDNQDNVDSYEFSFISACVESNGLRHRAWHRIHTTFRRTAERDAQQFHRMSQADFTAVRHPSYGSWDGRDDEEFQAAAEEAANLVTASAKDVLSLWQPKGLHSAPLTLNYLHFVETYIKYFGIRWAHPEYHEGAQYHAVTPGLLVQLQCGGLVMRNDTLHQLRKGAEENVAEQNRSVESEKPQMSATSAIASSAVADSESAPPGGFISEYLPVNTPLDAFYFSAAISKLLPLTCAMRASGCVFTLCHFPGEARDETAGYQLHPFIMRWPKDKEEFMKSVQRNFPQYASSESMAALDSSSSNCCGGVFNPDADLKDEDDEFRRETRDSEALYRETEHYAWLCDVKCPPTHKVQCPTETPKFSYPRKCVCSNTYSCFCADHMRQIRGCMWPNCGRGQHVAAQMLMRMMVGSPDYISCVETPFYRPGIRTDWKNFFQCSNPAVLRSPAAGQFMKPMSQQLSALVGSTLPWSIPVVWRGEDFLCQPCPGMIAAPLAPGWVGGFISTTTRDEH